LEIESSLPGVEKGPVSGESSVNIVVYSWPGGRKPKKGLKLKRKFKNDLYPKPEKVRLRLFVGKIMDILGGR